MSYSNELAQFSTGGDLTAGGFGQVHRVLTPRQKAAVVVRYLLANGIDIPLAQLPDHLQTSLAEQMGAMRLVDRDTLDQVVQEFLSELDSVGIAFSGGLEGALDAMDGHLSRATASRLRRKVGISDRVDPWERISHMPAEQILPLLASETVQIAAVVLSKMPVTKAADFLGQLPGERARRLAFAVSQTARTNPETVRRIGVAILSQLDAEPARAFERGPVERVGAILNVSTASLRDTVLEGLADQDAEFAEDVRRSIFTYAQLPNRVSGRDIPKILRAMDPAQLVTALAYAQKDPALAAASDYLLSCIPQRMAENLRQEMVDSPKVRAKDGEAALNEVITVTRQLESQGELVMLLVDEAE